MDAQYLSCNIDDNCSLARTYVSICSVIDGISCTVSIMVILRVEGRSHECIHVLSASNFLGLTSRACQNDKSLFECIHKCTPKAKILCLGMLLMKSGSREFYMMLPQRRMISAYARGKAILLK
ncbi:hypothetical protein RF11_00193 [Thelohanellus kitauei]|uniref:Uncharacterized protein n=1 Tax=Thelohanellus kitauei TaxID=669202 RepID=A0A0C2MHC2_THEKT|nr:hypothetical protein RF11_00193 [Thelohanellus kitauei]